MKICADPPKSHRMFLLVWFSIALGLSLGILPFNYFITPDGTNYARVGANIFAGNGLCSNLGEPYLRHPPFYSFIIGLVNLIFGNLEFSSHLVSSLAFALTLIPLFLFTRSAYSTNSAYWASILYATNGFLLIYSNMALSEPLFTSLLITELFLLNKIVRDDTKRSNHGFVLGTIAGLSYLTRPEGFFYYVAGAIALFFVSSKPRSVKIRTFILSLVAFLIFFIPYVRFINQTTRSLQLSNLSSESMIRRQLDLSNPGNYLEVKKMYAGLSEDKTHLKMDDLKDKYNLFDCLSKNRFNLIRSAFPSVIFRTLELNKYLFSGIGFFLIGASCLAVPWNAQRKKNEMLLFLFLLPFLCHLILEFNSRRYLPIFPLLLIWMGNGIEVFRQWTISSFNLSSKNSYRSVIILCFIFASLSGWYLYQGIHKNVLPLEHKTLGLWMKRRIPHIQNEKVASEHPYVSFYSGAKYLQLPYVERLEDLLTYMNHQKAKYFTVSSDFDTPLLDAYRSLLDENQRLPSNIRKIKTINEKNTIILFEIKNQ